jgi:hypothetical protein
VDHFAIPRAGHLAETISRFKDHHLMTIARKRPRNGEPNDPGTDNGGLYAEGFHN